LGFLLLRIAERFLWRNCFKESGESSTKIMHLECFITVLVLQKYSNISDESNKKQKQHKPKHRCQENQSKNNFKK
jgi:hypothetical protein